MWKIQTPPSSQSSLHLKCRLFWFWIWHPAFFQVFSTSWGGGRRAGGREEGWLGRYDLARNAAKARTYGKYLPTHDSQHGSDVACITAWINTVGLPLSRCWNCTLMIILGEIKKKSHNMYFNVFAPLNAYSWNICLPTTTLDLTPPPLWTFSTIYDIFFVNAPLTYCLP